MALEENQQQQQQQEQTEGAEQETNANNIANGTNGVQKPKNVEKQVGFTRKKNLSFNLQSHWCTV